MEPHLEEGLILTLMFMLSRSVTWPSFIPQSEDTRNGTLGAFQVMSALYSLHTGNPIATGQEDFKQRVVWCIGACKPIRRNPARMPFSTLLRVMLRSGESRLGQGHSRLELSPRQPEGSCLPGQGSPSQPVLLLFLASHSTYEAQGLRKGCC